MGLFICNGNSGVSGTSGHEPTYNSTNIIVGVAAVPGLISAIALCIKELPLLVSYVKNNAFPQPLAEDEEEKHLRLMAVRRKQRLNRTGRFVR
jgi:hypothetical protein